MKKIITLFILSLTSFDVVIGSSDKPFVIGPIEIPEPNDNTTHIAPCVNNTPNINLAVTPDNGCTHLIAQKQIRLLPGFRFNATDAQSGNTFSARIDQGILYPPMKGVSKIGSSMLSKEEDGYIVGSITGEHTVSNTGAAVYTVPIECPKGVNGMQPNISLEYNSQFRDGIMGWGWSIGGLSAITRSNKCQYLDGVTSSFDFSSSDEFALDGIRLIRIAETADSIEYKTEQDNYNRIVGYDIQSWGPKYFKIYTKDGKTLTYGDADGNIENYYPLQKRGRLMKGLSWLLTEVCDLNGNYITYENAIDNNELASGTQRYYNQRINKITYGTNKNGSGIISTIYFEYEPAPILDVKYLNGLPVKRNIRLKKIKVYNNNSLRSEYGLIYFEKDNKYKLKQISLAKNGVNIGPTQFVWSEDMFDISSVTKPTLSWNKIKDIAFGDFDGDGMTDHAFLLNNGDFVIGYKMQGESVYTENNILIRSFTFFDIDFDGLQEIIVGKLGYNTIKHLVGKWNPVKKIFEWKNLNDYANQWTVSTQFKKTDTSMSYSPLEIDNITEIPGDFLGNGTVQFIPILQRECTASSKSRNLSRTYKDAYLITSATGGMPDMSNISVKNGIVFITDVNGNGKSEITVLNAWGQLRVYEEKNGSFIEIMAEDNIGISTLDETFIGDFNGDGNTDFLIKKKDSSGGYTAYTVDVYVSTGRSLTNIPTFTLRQVLAQDSYIYVTDINSDGYDDILCCDDGCICLYLSNGNEFSLASHKYNQTINISQNNNLFKTKEYAPILSEGYFIQGQKSYATYGAGIIKITDSKSFDNIIEFKDGLANIISTEYENLEQQSYVVSGQTPLIGGLSEFVPKQNRQVVKRVQQNNSKGNIIQLDYLYGMPLYDASSQRALGFSTIKKSDVIGGTEEESTFSIKNAGLQIDKIVQWCQGKVAYATEYEYKILTDNTKSYSNNVSKVTTTDYQTGNKRIISFLSYDAYGNPKKINIQRGKQTVSYELSYSKAGSWCPSKPNYIKTSYKYLAQTENRYHYISYDKKGNLTSDYDNNVNKSFLDYDVFGNPQTVRFSVGNSKRTEHYTFTLSGRHIKSKTNLLGETTTYNWNESDGTLTSETDAYGRTTNYRYNGLGKRVETIYPDGRRSVSSLLWAENGNDLGASYYQYSETSGQSPEYIWYTSDGKEVCKQSYGYGGKLISVFTEYNNDGTVHRVSEPTFSSNAENWETEYIYDNYQRPIKISKPDGVTTIQYNGRTTVTTSPTTITEQTITAEGWKESVVTNGKRVNYTYYPTGLVKTATPEGGKTITLEYDQQGNRTILIDPDAGTVLDSYNAFGDILSSERTISDGRRVKTTYTYNDNGLLVQKNIGGDIIRYEYDGSNRLQRKDYGAAHSVEYKYDGFDRVTETKEIIEGNEHLFKTKYDFYGRVTEEKFPTNYAVTNHYDDYGYLTSQSDNQGNNIYEVQSVDAKGRILSERRNNKVTEYSYDAKNNLTDIHANGVLELQYKYRRDNNLPLSVCDKTAGLRQEYYYDNQSRLVSWPIFTATGGTPIQTNFLKYDDNNNIISRSAFGDCAIEYKNEDHPHAVSSIAGVPDIMPRIDQDISYTKFSKVERIDEGDNHYSITYGADQNRVKSVLRTPAGETTRLYLPNYEEVTNPLGTTDKIHYLCGGAVMVERDGQWNLYYCYSDRLGSIVAVTDKSGGIVERYAYTPWGERRDPNDWTKPDNRREFFTNRGFTGHEHLDAFNLIDMGGRVYDPMLGSFLSIDPYIQAPDNWLNYNRYLYCYGNPQIYTDPSGYESTLWWGDPGWTAPGYYEPSPNYSQYDSPGTVNWNTDTYKNTPSWWNNNSNTNYYGTNTGPGYIYVDPQTSHGQNTTSYSSGNPVYRKSQQGQKPVIVIPSISVINTQINNSTSPIIKTYTSGVTPRTWEDELGDWMRDFFNSHSEELTANRLRPWAAGFAVATPGVSLANSAKTLATGADLFGNRAEIVDYVLSTLSITTFGIGYINDMPLFIRWSNTICGYFSDFFGGYRTYKTEKQK